MLAYLKIESNDTPKKRSKKGKKDSKAEGSKADGEEGKNFVPQFDGKDEERQVTLFPLGKGVVAGITIVY